MTGNFMLNNLFTYRDRRLRGERLWTGLISFYAVCGAGAAANVGIAAHLVWQHLVVARGACRAAVSVVWNYAMSSIFTWSARLPLSRRPYRRACNRPRRCGASRPPAALSLMRRGYRQPARALL
jgi:hypothetical protein